MQIFSAPLFVLVAALAPQEPATGLDARALAFVESFVAYLDEAPGSDVETSRAFFDEGMRAALSAQAIESVLKPMRDSGSVRATLQSREEAGAGLVTFTFHLEQDHSLWSTNFTLDPAGKVAGWYVSAAPRHVARAELEAQLAKWEGDWGLALTLLDVEGVAEARVDLSSGKRTSLPLGSIFKLYVLAELARQVTAGKLGLEQEVAIEAARKSLPSGEMQDLADGTKVSVRRMAEQMIAISDNTATDHLLALVGRENVEAHLSEYKNSEVARNTPFLSTFELFLIKGVGKSDWQAAFGEGSLKKVAELWKSAEPDRKRAWLEALRARVAAEDPAKLRARLLLAYGTSTLFAPSHVEIEWLARPRDVVELLVAAHNGELVDAQTSRTFLDIYAEGTRIYSMPDVAEHGFKGGSETSVFALSARVVLEDGRTVIACLARSGFPSLDTNVSADTSACFLGWIRNAFEGDPPAKTTGAAK